MNWDYVILPLSIVLGLTSGLLFGLFPLRNDQMTPKQMQLTSTLSVLTVGGVVVLILLGKDVASYVLIGVVLAGFVIARIPAIHDWAARTFPLFQPTSRQVKKRKKTS